MLPVQDAVTTAAFCRPLPDLLTWSLATVDQDMLVVRAAELSLDLPQQAAVGQHGPVSG